MVRGTSQCRNWAHSDVLLGLSRLMETVSNRLIKLSRMKVCCFSSRRLLSDSQYREDANTIVLVSGHQEYALRMVAVKDHLLLPPRNELSLTLPHSRGKLANSPGSNLMVAGLEEPLPL